MRDKIIDVMLDLTDASFQKDVVEEAKLPVVVDFWAQWCGPCKLAEPVLEEIEKDFEGKVKIGKMNVDENITTPAKFGIMSIPTLVAFKNGQEVKRQVGFPGKEGYLKFLQEILA